MATQWGGFKRGFPDLGSSFLLFCPFWDFPDFSGIFPICSGMVRGFSRFVFFLFLGLLRAPTTNSPERVRDTIWTFPEKSGKPPGLETPRFSFSQYCSWPPKPNSKLWKCQFPADSHLGAQPLGNRLQAFLRGVSLSEYSFLENPNLLK